MGSNIILKSSEDYQSWDKLSEHCEILETLSNFEKEKAKRSFQFLKTIFGESFLKSAFETGHPLTQTITNLAPWTRKWFIWFAEALEELKEQENYDSLLIRIKDTKKFSEALSVLEVAHKLFKTGFKVCFDPKIKVGSNSKVPDIKVINKETDEIIYIEVSAQKQSKNQREASITAQKIVNTLWHGPFFLYYCGRIYKTLSKRHLDEVTNEIKSVLEKVYAEKNFYEYLKEDVIELGLATEEDKQILEKWAVERKLKIGEIRGPPFDTNELIRVKRAIDKEQRQLPTDIPNIVVINNSNLFFHIKDMRKAISELEEEVYQHPHLLITIISGSYVGFAEETSFKKDQHAFIRKTKFDILCEQHIVLLNKFCNYKISPNTLTKIYVALDRF